MKCIEWIVLLTLGLLALSLAPAADKRAKQPVPNLPEAPAAFDDKSNGVVDDVTHQADHNKFDETETAVPSENHPAYQKGSRYRRPKGVQRHPSQTSAVLL